ncbi:MAG: hypothetical protein Q9167_001426 [Letrouitia subvulpina]
MYNSFCLTAPALLLGSIGAQAALVDKISFNYPLYEKDTQQFNYRDSVNVSVLPDYKDTSSCYVLWQDKGGLEARSRNFSIAHNESQSATYWGGMPSEGDAWDPTSLYDFVYPGEEESGYVTVNAIDAVELLWTSSNTSARTYTQPNSTTNITTTSETKYTVNMTQYAPKSPCRFYVNDTQERREYTKTALLYIVSNGSTAEPVTWSVDRQAPSLSKLYQDEAAEGAASVMRGVSAMLAVGVGLAWGFVVIFFLPTPASTAAFCASCKSPSVRLDLLTLVEAESKNAVGAVTLLPDSLAVAARF